MTHSDDTAASRVRALMMTRLRQPVTLALPAWGVVAGALAVLALVVVALD